VEESNVFLHGIMVLSLTALRRGGGKDMSVGLTKSALEIDVYRCLPDVCNIRSGEV
jgi:hypothetical protein